MTTRVTKIKALAAALLFCAAFGVSAPAQEADPTTVERGMRVYQSETADCKTCHGWNGTGRFNDHQYVSEVDGIGPSLATSTMDRAAMIEVISCGRVTTTANTMMPQFRGDAWTASYPCGGKTKADLAEGEKPLQAQYTLPPAIIEALVTYIQEVYQGKSMSWEWCSKYFKDYERICEVWRDHGAQ